MRFPRLKVSVRGLMLLITGFALGIGADRTYQRFNFCMKRVRYYRSQAELHRKLADDISAHISNAGNDKFGQEGRGAWVDGLNRAREASDENDTLRAAFERAALVPFLRLPDEPESYTIP